MKKYLNIGIKLKTYKIKSEHKSKSIDAVMIYKLIKDCEKLLLESHKSCLFLVIKLLI